MKTSFMVVGITVYALWIAGFLDVIDFKICISGPGQCEIKILPAPSR